MPPLFDDEAALGNHRLNHEQKILGIAAEKTKHAGAGTGATGGAFEIGFRGFFQVLQHAGQYEVE